MKHLCSVQPIVHMTSLPPWKGPGLCYYFVVLKSEECNGKTRSLGRFWQSQSRANGLLRRKGIFFDVSEVERKKEREGEAEKEKEEGGRAGGSRRQRREQRERRWKQYQESNHLLDILYFRFMLVEQRTAWITSDADLISDLGYAPKFDLLTSFH